MALAALAAALAMPVRAVALDFAGAGVQTDSNPAELERDLDGLAATGANAVRLAVRWEDIEPDVDGIYDTTVVGAAELDCDSAYATLDRAICESSERGLGVVLLLNGTPSWARTPFCREALCAPADAGEYGEMAAELARRYSGMLLGLEVWNEPNTSRFLADGDGTSQALEIKAQRIAELAQATWRSIEALPPREQTRVILAGLASTGDIEFLELLYDSSPSIAGHFDAISTHPYSSRFAPGERRPNVEDGEPADRSFVAGMEDTYAVMRAHGDGDRSIWLTEFGWSTCTAVEQTPAPPAPFSVPKPQVIDPQCLSQDATLSVAGASAAAQARQAIYIAQAFDLLQERFPYVEGATIYQWRNAANPSSGQRRDANCWECQLGLLDGGFEPKLGYHTFATAVGAALDRP